jgi:hypothetical protein
MPQLVNGDYSTEAAKKGTTIDVPIPTAQAASDVTPSNTPPAPADTATQYVQIPLDNWKKTNFHLTDKEMVEIDKNEHFLPMQVGEAIRSLSNAINESIHAEYPGIYGFSGTAGTTPFASDAQAMIDARKRLHQQLTPRNNRRCVLDFDAEANALGLSTFADANRTADAGAVKREGEVGRKYGFDIFTDDVVTSHTAGSATGYLVDDASHAAGVKTVAVDTGSNDAVVGDLFTVAGNSQQFVITGITGSAPMTAISYEPANVVAFADDAAITFLASHVVNLAFHRDAFALAMRPLLEETSDMSLGSELVAAQDQQTGLTLRLEVSRQYKQVVWEFDVLWGVKLVRPQLAARIMG